MLPAPQVQAAARARRFLRFGVLVMNLGKVVSREVDEAVGRLFEELAREMREIQARHGVEREVVTDAAARALAARLPVGGGQRASR